MKREMLTGVLMTAFMGATLVLGVAGPLPSARAEGPTVTGAGSTWVQNALDQWRADVQRYGININYQGVGSSAGRQLFIQDQVDFAASEIPFEPNEVSTLNQNHKSFIYFPDVAGGTSFMYNLRDASGTRIRDLRLSGVTLAKIFTRDITYWDDPAITSDNNGRVLPHTPITPVVRSDGSGTSAQFTLYLLKTQNSIWCSWATRHGIDPCTYTSNWPQASGYEYQSGSDGVANFVANDATGNGAITYVETSYALQRGFPVAAVKNAAGNYSLPTSANVAVALTKAKLNPDRTQNLDDVYTNPDPRTYPVSSYSYMIAQTAGFDPAKGSVLGKFILYFACTGQRKADQLGYSPLPPNLVKVVFDAEQQIPGAPKPPPLQECDNPTIKGGVGSVGNSTGRKLSSGGGSSGVIPPTAPVAGGTGPAGQLGGARANAQVGPGSGSALGGFADSVAPEGLGNLRQSGPGGGGASAYTAAGPFGTAADFESHAPSTLPTLVAGLLIVLAVFLPPAFAITVRRERSPG